MTKNEYIASIMLEAAELLKKEDNNINNLNEGAALQNALLIGGTAAIMSIATIGGTIMMLKSSIKKDIKDEENKRNKENEKKNKKLEECKRKAKIAYDNNTFRKNQFIESISKKPHTINDDDELRELILKDARKLISICNKSPKVKEEFEKSFKKHFSDDEINDKSFHNFLGLCVEDEGDYIQIINGTQDDCIALGWFIDDLADVLEEKWGVGIGTGDGDEGCIYLW